MHVVKRIQQDDREVVSLKDAAFLAWDDPMIIQYWARFKEIEVYVTPQGQVMYYVDSLMNHAKQLKPILRRKGG